MRASLDAQPLAGCTQYPPTIEAAGADLLHPPLSHTNLTTHTTALQQHVLGQRPSASRLHPPASLCGKRSRSNSDSSPSSASSPSSFASVFSFENDHADSGYESQTSVELSPSSSRKSSSGESQQQLSALTAWRSSISELDAARVCKKLKPVQGTRGVAAAATEFISAVDGAIATSLAQSLAATTLPSSTASSSSSSSNSISSSSISSVGATASNDGKVNFVDNLVDAAVRTLDAIWDASVTSSSTSCDIGERQGGLPLQIFVRETLRRGRTSCSTLQAALLYCARMKGALNEALSLAASQASNPDASSDGVARARSHAKMLNCPRRMFLAAIMVSSKFVQDRTYSNRAWSKISGLPVKELGKIERAFLAAIDYHLVVGESEWETWVSELMKPSASGAAANASFADFLASGTRRSSLNRSVSDNVTGAALPLDTELRAASPQTPSQVLPKYRSVASECISSSLPGLEICVGAAAEPPLPYPMAMPAGVAEV
ncbi:PHO85 cyclin-5 [Thecaphora frezii]